MVEKIIEKFEAGEYNGDNGKRLFELDMSEVKAILDEQEDRLYEFIKGDEIND